MLNLPVVAIRANGPPLRRQLLLRLEKLTMPAHTAEMQLKEDFK
jgi:hypothetical protein